MYIVKRNLNLRKDPDDNRDINFKVGKKTRLPKRVDWQHLMSPVKDQESLGSCVGFAVTAVKEFQEQIEHASEVASGKKYQREGYQDLSESWIYWMAKKIDLWPNEEGTSIRYAMKVLQKIGVPIECAWPYDIKYTDPKVWAPLIAKWGLIKSYERINDLNELKEALQLGPVAIGIGCFKEIFTPNKDGLVAMPKNPNDSYGGHAIAVVAYNDVSQQIKFKNSWGTTWGDKGYGRLSYDYINYYMWDAWTCVDLSVTNEMLKGTTDLLKDVLI